MTKEASPTNRRPLPGETDQRATAAVERRMIAWDRRVALVAYRIRQEGLTVAQVEGPEDRAEREALHYAAQYLADGPVTVERREGKRWKLAARVTTPRMLKGIPHGR